MMFLRSSTAAGAAASITPALPTGWAIDDILILACESNNGQAVVAPTGYTEVTTSSASPQDATDTRLTVFWKRAVSGETAPTIANPGDHITATLVAIAGVVNTGSPIESAAGAVATSGSSAITYPSVTPTVIGQGILNIVATGADSAANPLTAISQPNTDTTNQNSAFSATTAAGGGGVRVDFGQATAASAIASTGTMSNTGAQAKISLVLVAASDANDIVYNEQFVTVASSLAETQDAALNIQMITVVVVATTLSRRRGFMSFTPT